MRVEKQKFDAALTKLLRSKPQPRKKIQAEDKQTPKVPAPGRTR